MGEDDGEGSLWASHPYADNGTYTVTVTLKDVGGTGQSATRTATVAVVNALPKVDVGGFVQRYTIGDTIPLAADVFDPGLADTHTFAWTIRDAATNAVVATSAAQSFNFTPTATGVYKLTCVATDDDGGVGSTLARLIVLAVGAPVDTSVPDAPTGMTLGSVSPDGIGLSWADNSDDEDGFAIEWSPGDGEYYIIGVVPDGTTAYTDEFPMLNAGNSYRVFAYRDDAESAATPDVTGTPYTASAATGDDNGGPNVRDTLSQFATTHDVPLPGSVFENDLAFSGEVTYHAQKASDPSHGTVTMLDDGSFLYTPAAGFIGTDSFTYTIDNGHYTSAPADVTIDVTNEPPTPGAAVAVTLDGPADDATDTVPAAGDADGDSFEYVVDKRPKYGTLTLGATGEYHYVPGADFPGYDSFTYHADDGLRSSREDHLGDGIGRAGLVAFRAGAVTGRNWYSVVLKIQWAGYNTEDIPHEGVIISNGAKGELVRDGYRWIYTPHADEVGTDYVRMVNEVNGRRSKDYFLTFVIIDPANPPTLPTYGSRVDRNVFPVQAGAPTTYGFGTTNFLAQNPDAHLAMAQDAQHGKVKLSGDGGLTYTPNPGEEYAGWDYFSFRYTGDPRRTAGPSRPASRRR